MQNFRQGPCGPIEAKQNDIVFFKAVFAGLGQRPHHDIRIPLPLFIGQHVFPPLNLSALSAPAHNGGRPAPPIDL